MTVISVIVGSTREGRFSEKPAKWILQHLKKRQQLRETAVEIQLAPIRSSVHIPVSTLWAHYQGGDVDAGLAELEAPAGAMIHDLLWWTAALKAARAGVSP
jgi:hypothetical protein